MYPPINKVTIARGAILPGQTAQPPYVPWGGLTRMAPTRSTPARPVRAHWQESLGI